MARRKISQLTNPDLKDINTALKIFPKVVREQKIAHRENEKVIKRFMSLAKKLDGGKLKVSPLKNSKHKVRKKI